MLSGIRGLRNSSFRKMLNKYFQMLLFLTIPISILIGALLLFQIHTQKSDILSQSNSLAQKSAAEMDGKLFSVRDIAINTSADERVLKLLRSDRRTLSKSLIVSLQDVQTQMRAILNVTPIIDELVIYFEDDQFIVTQDSGKRFNPELQSFNEKLKAWAIYDLYPSENGWKEINGGLAYYQSVSDTKGRNGAILATISNSNLTKAFVNTLPLTNSSMVLIDQNGNLIASSAAGLSIETFQNAGIFTEDKRCYSVSKVSSLVNGWSYALIIDQTDYAESWNSSIVTGMICFAIALLISFLAAFLLAIRFCRPFETILKLLKMPTIVTSGEYERDYKKIDELGMISTLIRQNKYQELALQNELTQRERMLFSAQNAVLQAQMNPHFLFNTLESINWLVIEKLSEDNEITAMISRLAHLLRISMRTHQPLTSIQEELEHGRMYVEIQKVRFQDRFIAEWEIDEHLLQYTTVRLSLQPLIENAIRHGIKAKQEGHIKISVFEDDDDIVFEVHDNGKGISRDELEKLRTRLASQPFLPDDKIGIVNLSNRLRLLFAERGRLEVSSTLGIDTCFSIHIPRIPFENAEEYFQKLQMEVGK